ncbi:21137_t:CDS:2 [Dentiscutata erythropus]|uniref:21137_t:CDS:1 n=1 Tax=Dentiscutata erythropus TaxID=1348616 RepID=A0A9N9N7I5_9GLOM|nr:21137_t:CDS:2 [Dentiscutata erythropus]
MSDIDNNKIGNKQQDDINTTHNETSNNEHDDNFKDQGYTWLSSGEMLNLPTKIFKDNTLPLDERQTILQSHLSTHNGQKLIENQAAKQEEIFGSTNLKEILEKENAKNKLEIILPDSDVVSKASHAFFLEKTTGSQMKTWENMFGELWVTNT